MAEPRPPTARRTESTPQPPPNFTGVLIAAPSVVTYRARLVVSGVYQIPEAEARGVDERLHRALVALRTSGVAFRAWNPFLGVVLFEDDDERNAWGRRGSFDFDAFPEQPELYPGDYYLMVSLGVYVSNPVRFQIR